MNIIFGELFGSEERKIYMMKKKEREAARKLERRREYAFAIISAGLTILGVALALLTSLRIVGIVMFFIFGWIFLIIVLKITMDKEEEADEFAKEFYNPEFF